MQKLLPMMSMLVGCGIDSLEGDWNGDIDCVDGAEARLEIDIDDSEGELDYVGDFFLQAASLFEQNGETYRLESDWAGTLTLSQVLPKGEQEITFDLQEREPDCRIYKEGNLLGDDCYEDGLPIGFTFDSAYTADWDGLDTLDVDNGRCDGELER